MSQFDYINQYYGVNACIGRKVVVDGKSGVIVDSRGNYIGVNFDSDKPSVISNCHPTWHVEYGEIGKVRKQTKSQQRYQRYLEYGDSFNSFIEFCCWDTHWSHPWNGVKA